MERVTGPPATRPETQPTSRGVEKQARAYEGGRGVRIVGEAGVLLDVCQGEQLERYLEAPNAEIKRSHRGRIVSIKLRSVGDDRTYSGERHGSSLVTTRRIGNDYGALVGSDMVLEHKPLVGR
jgi:hypothetical protein